jgi:hypothetical protein
VHLTRFVAYVVLAVALGFAISGTVSLFGTLQKMSRRRRIRRVIGKFDEKDREIVEQLGNAYIDEGRNGLDAIRSALQDEGRLLGELVLQR